MDGMRLGLIGRLIEDALQGEAVGVALDLVAEDAGELGEGLELGGFRGGMDAAQEGDVPARRDIPPPLRLPAA